MRQKKLWTYWNRFMTPKRETKRKVRKVFSYIFAAMFVTLIIVGVFFAWKIASSLLSLDTNHSDNLIKPIGSATTIPILQKELSDKGIVMDSLREASESGVFEGVVRDGPKVLFSQNLDSKWQILSLVLILQKTTVDNKKPALIDLTTNRPIVKF